MTPEQLTEKAKSSLKDLFKTLGITRVICVDDTYDTAYSLDRAVVAAVGLGPESLSSAIPELVGKYPSDSQVRGVEIRRVLSGIDQIVLRERIRLIVAAAGDQGSAEADDIVDASLLESLLPEGVLVTLSPTDWDRDRLALTTEDEIKRTLFLFDQDLSRGAGLPDDGIRTIASLLSERERDRVICGLLTHTVTPEGWFDAWAGLAERYGVPMDRFLAIPKRYLSQDPALFAQNVKLIAISPDFSRMKVAAKKLLEDAATKAAEEVDKIRIWDLDHIVFRVQGQEGNWEPDMLFRLYALFHRKEARRLAHSTGELEEIAGRLRSVSQIATTPVHKPPSNAWDIQRAELYETSEYISRNHLPVELGDIFVKKDTDSSKHYILLAQPCDLMVRANGERQPELAHVALAEIVQSAESPNFAEPMICFGESSDETWWVNLRRVHQVHMCVLDLCVYNDSGIASISFDTEVSDRIRPAWKARYPLLQRRFNRIRTRVEILSPLEGERSEVASMKAKLRSGLSRMFMDEGFFSGTLVDRDGSVAIVFNCQRVGRLTETRALGLLMGYTSLLSRPAYEPDLFNETGK